MTDFIFRKAEPKQNFAEYWDEIPEFGYYIEEEILPGALRQDLMP